MVERRQKWTVKERDVEVVAVGYDQRGIYGVPVDAEGVDVTVRLITLGAYPCSNQYVTLIKPTETELEMLRQAGWKYDGMYASVA